MQKILIYSTKFCPNCKILKELFKRENVQYEDINMSTPQALTELRMNSIFALSAPVLQIDNKFYTTKELCKQGTIDHDKVRTILNLIN